MFTKVFQGALSNYSVPGPVKIILDTHFNYNGVGNLVVAVNELRAGYDTSFFIGYNLLFGKHGRASSWANTQPWNIAVFDSAPAFTYPPTGANSLPKTTFQGLSPLPCQSPKSVQFSTILHNSAKMAWSPPATGNNATDYDVYFSTSRYKPMASTTPVKANVADTQTVFLGLNPDTWYYAWVRSHSATANCSSVWTVVDSFRTLCAPLTAPTVAEQFNSFTPQCWDRAVGTLSNPTVFLARDSIHNYQFWKKAPYRNQLSSTNFSAAAFINSDTLRHWLISPPYDLGSSGNTSLEFDIALTQSGTASQGYLGTDDQVSVVISTDEGLTWKSSQRLQSWFYTSFIPAAGTHIALPLSTYSGVVRIGFYVQSTIDNGNMKVFIDNVKISQILPVTLSEFTGKKEGTSNLLSWRTYTEQNNRGFELQKSVNGIDFSSIAFVPTKAAIGGNSTAEISYGYSDTKPFTGNNYYRLKQMDFDGKATLSNVVLIKGSRGNELMLTSIYPNPTSKTLHVVINAPASQTAQLLIADLAGRSVQQQTTILQSGDNNLDVNVAPLAKGVYILKVVCSPANGGGCEAAVSKFVKE